ncbi:hypothetical protein [Bradyrhizobium erythrophlei]|uniref:Helix-turn-helix domain-containing protein n=1 Tax=Bradyrhizobium erythrophlei TaxID=1437360 RepID=A0A1M5S127_9BRAD|nr:hypothetical protein [Bradyrhizobium erythrophlei]SHH32307.1 hypothetical protein SAMN05444169_6889 [Bradyrhizobium erythrophlei]
MVPDRAINEPEADPPAAADPPEPASRIAALTAELVATREMLAVAKALIAEIEKPPRRWMGLKAAARHEGVRYETARRWTMRGSVVARKDHGRVFVDLASLQEYIARSQDR